MKDSGSGAIYSTDTNAGAYCVEDSSRAATYPFFSSSDATHDGSSTKGVATYDRPFTKPWELYQGRPEHPLKLLQDFKDNSMKPLSEPLEVKQAVTSPTVPHVSQDRPVSPTDINV